MKTLPTYIQEKLFVKKDTDIASDNRYKRDPNYVPKVFKDRRKTEYSDEELLGEYFLSWCGWFNGKTGLSSNPRATKLADELCYKYPFNKNTFSHPTDKLVHHSDEIEKACGVKRFWPIKDAAVARKVKEIIHLNMDYLLNGESYDKTSTLKLP